MSRYGKMGWCRETGILDLSAGILKMLGMGVSQSFILWIALV